jgi:hypothetical protein
MVRRRVDQKFDDLCLNVVQNWMIPFATRVVEERSSTKKKPILPQLVQTANMTFFDCLQLVDDTVRIVFSGGLVLAVGSSACACELRQLSK